MNIEDQIRINKFGQGLLKFHDIKLYFSSLDNNSKKQFLNDLTTLLLQSKPLNSDIEEAIKLSDLKPTFTPVVKIRNGISSIALREIAKLPEHENEKILVLFLSLYKIAYSRLLKSKASDDPTKWWLQDLSNSEFVSRIQSLSEIKLITRRIYDLEKNEVGAAITAWIPYALNLYEKSMVETQLEYYAFHTLYPEKGLTIYKEIYEDVASLIVFTKLDDLKPELDRISIY